MGFQRTMFRKKLAEMRMKKVETEELNGKEIYTRKERRTSKMKCFLLAKAL